jgi:glycosyltransferase involved in cell wall biosynthesis
MIILVHHFGTLNYIEATRLLTNIHVFVFLHANFFFSKSELKTRNVQNLLRRRSFSDRVVIVERETEVYKLMNIADVYLNTSRWEGLSLAVIEAMATMIPVVLSDVVGNKGLVGSNFNSCFLVGEQNVDQFARIIVAVLSDEALSASTGKLLRQQVVNEFDIKKNAEKIENLYRLAIERKHCRTLSRKA